MKRFQLCAGVMLCAAPSAAFAAAIEGQSVQQPLNVIAIAMFGAFVALTLGITAWATSQTRTAADFYTGGRGINGFQNGLAIAGDFMSAASFLGISAQIFSDGYDGLIYSIGFLVGWPILLFLIAERLRNLGKYTFADAVAFRLGQPQMRSFAAIASLAIVAFYLIAQMVGAGQLIKLLFGLPYRYAVGIVGVLMIVYVLCGGMRATTWVQITKAGLLLLGASAMAFLVLSKTGFSLETLFSRAIEVKTGLAAAKGLAPAEAAAKGASIMAPGAFIKDPVSAISLGMALMFGTAGLPHILMRFFTVPNAKQARLSVLWATVWIGYFYILTFIIGFGAIVFVASNPSFLDGDGLRGGANMAAVHLAGALGGDMLLGFISAVAFATILAVVAGLTLAGATAISHDLYATVLRPGGRHELRVSRITTVALGVVAVALGIAFEKQNVAFMVSLAFALAASSTFPVLITSLLWKGATTRGALWGGLVGLVTALVLMVLSPAIWVTVFHKAEAIFPFSSPTIFSMPLAFAVMIVVSKLDRSRRGDQDRAAFVRQTVIAETGLGAADDAGAH